jgi:hypothetical protein
MTWQPNEEVDREIRRWMKAKGWEVTRSKYNADKDAFAWRHDIPSANALTLWIARSVLEEYPAFALLEILDQLNVARAIRARPDARLVVVQRGSRVTVEEW